MTTPRLGVVHTAKRASFVGGGVNSSFVAHEIRLDRENCATISRTKFSGVINKNVRYSYRSQA